ncbi:MAG: hypothetical protein JSR61_17285 [Proteobacteria bacterium]|nr:hypothetical protein [Pseudomonadota bacterium]
MTTRRTVIERPRRIPPQIEDVLLESLKALATTGHTDTACRLAGQACAAVRQNSPVSWKAFNAFLHRYARYAPDP